MFQNRTRLLSAITGVALTLSTTAIAASPPEEDVRAAGKGLSGDKAKTNAWLQTEIVSRLLERNDSNLVYTAVNIASVKNEAGLNKVFTQATGDHIDEIMDRDATVSVIKAGSKYFTGGLADKSIDFGNKVTADMEKLGNKPSGAMLGSIGREAQVTIFLGAMKNMSPDLQEKALRKFAELEALNYDQMRQRVTEGRMLVGTPSKDPNSHEKGLDQTIFDQGILDLKNSLDAQSQVLQNLNNNIRDDKELAARQQAIADQTQHFKTGVYLAGVILGPVVGQEAASNITTAASGLIQMQEAVQKFGPGSLSADKLLMCTNFVSAGMMVAGIFMKQPDPTMAALTAIMSQLQDIKKQLDIIDHKIDRLTDLVLQGFTDVLQGQQWLSKDISKLNATVDAYVRNQAEKEAIGTYLTYVKDQQAIPRLAQACASGLTIQENSSNNCASWFADELSTEPLSDVDLKNVGRPHIFDPSWTNQALSLGIEYDTNNSQLPQFYFSLPRFFANAPNVFMSITGWNHEAAAAASNLLLKTARSQTLANPDTLLAELRVLMAATRLRPELTKVQYADRLFSQSIQRIDDLDNFLRTTIRDQAYMQSLWEMLAQSLKNYDNGVQIIVNDALARPTDEAKKRFLTGGMRICDLDSHFFLHLPKNGPNGNLENLVPDIYWTAQDMGLGRVGNCYSWNTPMNERIVEGSAAYYNVHYDLEVFWTPAERQPDGSYKLDPLEGGRVVKRPNSQVIQGRSIQSVQLYTNVGGGSAGVWTGAWDGVGTPLDCVPQEPGGFSIPRNIDKCAHIRIPSAVALTEGQVLIPKDQVDATAAGLAEAIHSVLSGILRARSRVWNTETLAFENIQEERILLDRPSTTGVNLANLMSAYSGRFMFAQQLLLIGAYHQNAMSDCLAALSAFSPESVVEYRNIYSGGIGWRLSETLEQTMSSRGTACIAKDIHPALMEIRTQLKQAASAVH
jgi:hypothetical protein